MSESEKETPHVTAARRQWLLKNKARKKFRVANGKVETYDAAPPAQDLEATVAAATKAAGAETITRAQIGEMIEGHGIYFGTWEPKDDKGKSLGKIFNMFAAPEDIRMVNAGQFTFSYDDAVKHIAALKKWHGHAGANYANSKEIIKALQDGSYNGGWFMPPCEVLTGKDGNDVLATIQPDNLHAHKDKGKLNGTFVKVSRGGYDLSDWYWSSTERPSDAFLANFVCLAKDPSNPGVLRKTYRLSCRPVRLEPKP